METFLYLKMKHQGGVKNADIMLLNAWHVCANFLCKINPKLNFNLSIWRQCLILSQVRICYKMFNNVYINNIVGIIGQSMCVDYKNNCSECGKVYVIEDMFNYGPTLKIEIGGKADHF